MSEMFSAAQDRARLALSLDDKASKDWEVLHTSASTAEVLAAGGRYVCTMHRDAPEDLAFLLEARKLLPLLATDCQTLAAELKRLLEARDLYAADEARRITEALEVERGLLATGAEERSRLLAKITQLSLENNTLRADAAQMRAEVEASGPWEQNPVVWERFCKAAADWDPRTSCAKCGVITWLAFRATYCKLHRSPAGSPCSDWLPDRRAYPLPDKPSGQPTEESVDVAQQDEQKVLGFVDENGIPRVKNLRETP